MQQEIDLPKKSISELLYYVLNPIGTYNVPYNRIALELTERLEAGRRILYAFGDNFFPAIINNQAKKPSKTTKRNLEEQCKDIETEFEFIKAAAKYFPQTQRQSCIDAYQKTTLKHEINVKPKNQYSQQYIMAIVGKFLLAYKQLKSHPRKQYKPITYKEDIFFKNLTQYTVDGRLITFKLQNGEYVLVKQRVKSISRMLQKLIFAIMEDIIKKESSYNYRITDSDLDPKPLHLTDIFGCKIIVPDNAYLNAFISKVFREGNKNNTWFIISHEEKSIWEESHKKKVTNEKFTLNIDWHDSFSYFSEANITPKELDRFSYESIQLIAKSFIDLIYDDISGPNGTILWTTRRAKECEELLKKAKNKKLATAIKERMEANARIFLKNYKKRL